MVHVYAFKHERNRNGRENFPNRRPLRLDPYGPALPQARAMTTRPLAPAQPRGPGLPAGLAAYALWGFLPLLFHALRAVPPLELIAWRVVFTLPVCVVFLTVLRGWGDLYATLRRPRVAGYLVLSAILLSTNWTIYVSAVVSGHVLATSLGYYINPLINVLIGTVFLGERLGWRQWCAVGIAALGILLLLGGAIGMLGTALALAVTFALYGLVRKLTPVTAITGMTIETMVLYPAAVGWAWITAHGAHGSAMALGGATPLLIMASGLLTAIPLILFAVAARNLTLSLRRRWYSWSGFSHWANRSTGCGWRVSC
eukprot:gene13230-13337_t